MSDFLHKIELRSHADFAETIPLTEYPMGVIALLNLNWDDYDKKQSIVYFDSQGQPTSFDATSFEDMQKRLDVGKSIKILEQQGREVAHLTSVRTDESDDVYIDDFLVPRPAFREPELTAVGESQEELTKNVVLMRALLDKYLYIYTHAQDEVSVQADGQTHPLFDAKKFALTRSQTSMAAD
jgi:hypothetical protein